MIKRPKRPRESGAPSRDGRLDIGLAWNRPTGHDLTLTSRVDAEAEASSHSRCVSSTRRAWSRSLNWMKRFALLCVDGRVSTVAAARNDDCQRPGPEADPVFVV